MQTGISKIILPKLTLAEFFKEASETGYETVELCLEKEGEFTLGNLDTSAKQINDLSKQYNLPVVSVVHWQCTGNLLACGDSRKTGVEETIKGLHAADAVGAKCTLHTMGSLLPEVCYDEAYENAVTSLKEIAVTAEKTGVILAVEFIWNGFAFSPLEMKHLLDDVGSEYVGFYFDPGNMAVFHYPQHWVRILGKYVKMVHMKDWKGNALNGTWPALLSGDLDFPVIVRELRAIGYDGPMISEVETGEASLEESLASIKKIISMN